MNMRDYPILHLRHKYLHYKLFIYFNLCLSVILDSLSCSFTSILFVTKYWTCSANNMDVNEHERLSNITLKTQIKVNEQLVVQIIWM
jgi:hypothetical protein